jgi:hypothetical protein
MVYPYVWRIKTIIAVLYFQSDWKKVLLEYLQNVMERCGQTLGTSFTYQNKKNSPYQYVSGNI